MTDLVQELRWLRARYWKPAIILLVILTSAYLGLRVSPRWLLLLMVGIGGGLLLKEPRLGLLGVIATALIFPLEIGTGTEVTLSSATLLIPSLFGLWLLGNMQRREWRWNPSRVHRPLLFFLLAGLLSLIIGNGTWDPALPKSATFWLVQLAQWAIFLLAALIFWLVAHVSEPELWLPRLTWVFLALGGGIAFLLRVPLIGTVIWSLTTEAVVRAPFWMLLTALSLGQLLFNGELRRGERVFLWAVLGAVFVYAFFLMRDRSSNWVGVVTAAGVLFWLRFVNLRVTVGVILVLALFLGVFWPYLYEFAGGEEKWEESGGSRLVLIERVVQVTLRNPITGLGPASYRLYAGATPLRYQRALWFHPQISSHNNYVDLFAHTGLLGLGFFLWFAAELGWLGFRLHKRHRTGFASGYVNGVLAAWIGSLVLMLLADWILPFVYNIGFSGFQASLLVWMFLGGLVALERLS